LPALSFGRDNSGAFQLHRSKKRITSIGNARAGRPFLAADSHDLAWCQGERPESDRSIEYGGRKGLWKD